MGGGEKQTLVSNYLEPNSPKLIQCSLQGRGVCRAQKESFRNRAAISIRGETSIFRVKEGKHQIEN